MGTKAAALTRYCVNPEILDSVEAAKLLAQTTLIAPVFIYVGHLPAPELIVLFLCGVEQQMKVCRVNIAVGKHLSFCQSRQRAHDGGFAGAAFTA